MKRDMGLIRNMLLYIESHDALPDPDAIGVDEMALNYHVKMLNEADYVFGVFAVETDTGPIQVCITTTPRLTWKGHEFLDAARDDGVWSDVQKQTRKVGGTVAVAVMIELLKDAVRRKLGMTE